MPIESREIQDRNLDSKIKSMIAALNRASNKSRLSKGLPPLPELDEEPDKKPEAEPSPEKAQANYQQ